MDRRQFLTLGAAAVATPAFTLQSEAKVLPEPANSAKVTAEATDRIEMLPKFGALWWGLAGVTEPRIRLWLPPGYAANSRPYRTLYMLDGQYCFTGDSDGMNFAADTRVARLMATDTIAPTIIVAIDNLEDYRFLQYTPEALYDRAAREPKAKSANGKDVHGGIDRERSRLGSKPLVSMQLIRFLEEQLKPYVDAHYHASKDRNDTVIFGASQAGVMAGAIFVEGAKSFGRGACMSPNWAFYDERFIDYPALPQLWAEYFAQVGAPNGRRLWLDHGTQMMDAGMVPHQRAIAGTLKELGWVPGCNVQTRVYEAGHAFANTATQMDEVLAWILA